MKNLHFHGCSFGVEWTSNVEWDSRFYDEIESMVDRYSDGDEELTDAYRLAVTAMVEAQLAKQLADVYEDLIIEATTIFRFRRVDPSKGFVLLVNDSETKLPIATITHEIRYQNPYSNRLVFNCAA